LVTAKIFFKLKQGNPLLFNQIIAAHNGDVYGYANDQAYPVNRMVTHHTAPTPAIGLSSGIHLVNGGFDDSDNIISENYYNQYNEFDVNFNY